MISDGNDVFTWSAQTGATLLPNSLRRTAPYNPLVNQNTGVTAVQTVVSDSLTIGGGGTGFINPLALQIKYQAAQNTSGSNTVQFALQESTDNVNWSNRVVSDTITLSTTPQGNTVSLPFSSQAKYLRISAIVGGAGAGSTVTITQALLTPTLN